MSFFRGLSGFIVGAGLGGTGLIAAMAFISPVTMENSPEKAVPEQIAETTELKQPDMVEVMPVAPEIAETPAAVKEEIVAIVTPDPVETAPPPKIIKVKPPVLPKSEDVAKEPVVMDKPAKVELPKIDAKEPEKPTEITIGKKPSSTLPTIEPKETPPTPVVKAPVEEVKPPVVIAGNALKLSLIHI